MDLTELLLSLFFAMGCAPLAFFMANCPCCPSTTCVNCDDGTQPNQVQAVISGITNGACSNCANLDGTYIVTAFTNCRWTVSFSSICLFNGLTITLGAIALDVSMGRNFPGDMVWTSTDAAISDCDNWSSLNIPDSNSDTECDNSTATCLLTAL